MRTSIKRALLQLLDQGKAPQDAGDLDLVAPSWHLQRELVEFMQTWVPELYTNLASDGIITPAEIRRNALYLANQLRTHATKD